MAREKPWTGFGLGIWPTVYPANALYDDGTFVNEAHNDWLQWAVEGGVPLVAAMLARPAPHAARQSYPTLSTTQP
jgi:O-antigen ligase